MSETKKSSLLAKITVIIVICCCSLPAQAKYGGGTGEPNDPYLIYDANQMNAIGADSNDWDKCFLLYADIDLSSYTGTSFNIIGHFVEMFHPENKPFIGVFDGNGHTISNFTYTSPGARFVGLFGYIDDPNAVIKNLGLIDPNVDAETGDCVGSLVGINGGNITNCYVEGGGVSGNENVGGLVGANMGDMFAPWPPTGSLLQSIGEISNCHSTCSISGNENVGGLVGSNRGFCVYPWPGTQPPSCWRATISNCYSTGNITGINSVGGLVGSNGGTITNCDSTGSVLGDEYVGGLVGDNSVDAIITNCYSTGSASGNNNVGGLVGRNDALGTLTNCYSSAGVSGVDFVGGLVGTNGSYGTITNCYSTASVSGEEYVGGLVGLEIIGWPPLSRVIASFWDINTSGQTTSAGGTGLPTNQMQMASTFIDAGWDFYTPLWTIDEGVDYPRLWWEFVPVLHAEPEVTLGTSNTISWEPISGEIEYFAECSEDANFTSIIYSTGWITETSFEFTGLELGKRYFYSVKARNAEGVESQWSNVESSLQGTLIDAVDIMLDPNSLKNKNAKNTLLNKIDAAMKMIDQANYTSALSKLEQDILQKTNGCAETGQPDKNDWIITCEAQSEIYPLIIETIEHVKALME